MCFIGTWGNSSDVCPGSSGALCIARRGWGSAVPVSVLLQRDSGGLPRAESAERAAEHSPQRRATVSAPKHAIHEHNYNDQYFTIVITVYIYYKFGPQND